MNLSKYVSCAISMAFAVSFAIADEASLANDSLLSDLATANQNVGAQSSSEATENVVTDAKEVPLAEVKTPKEVAKPIDYRSYYDLIDSSSSKAEMDLYEDWIKGKLTIGATMEKYKLTDTERPADPDNHLTFLGNITELSAPNDTYLSFSVHYHFFDYVRVGYMQTELEVRTMNWNNHESDGNAILDGPTYTVELSVPLWEKRIIPHIGYGHASLKGDFHTDDWWGAGYPDPLSYEIYGSEGPRSMQRTIHMADASVSYLTYGISVRPWEHLEFDLSYRSYECDVDCSFGYMIHDNYYKKSSGSFSFDNDCWLFSIAYVF